MAEKIIIVYESVWSSWLKDFGSLGSLAGLIAVNHEVGSGSSLVDAVGVCLLVLWMMSKSSRSITRMTVDELREFVNKYPPKQEN